MKLNLHFGDGSKQLISKSRKTLQHIYKIPGVYRASLEVGQKVLAETTIQVKTAGWESAVHYNKTFHPISKTFKRQEDLYMLPKRLNQAGINTDSIYWVIHRNIKDYNVSADDFLLEARVRNNPEEGGISCYDFITDIHGANNDIKLEFLEAHCLVWADFQVSDIKIDGKATNLSAFGQNLSNWRVMRLEVKNKIAHLSVDNRPIYRSPAYNASIGFIKGITVGFKGSGRIDYLRLYDGSKRLVYKDDFN